MALYGGVLFPVKKLSKYVFQKVISSGVCVIYMKGKIMDDLEKRKIYNLIQLALQAFQSNKYQIMERSGVGGVKSVD